MQAHANEGRGGVCPPRDRRAEAKTRAKPSKKPLRKRALSYQTKVTNGTHILPGVDQSSFVARRYYDITAAIASDQGGVENMTEARHQLVRRFAAAAVLAELMEARFANGEQIDVNDHARLTSTMCRVVSCIGIDRRSRDVTPTLKDILADPTLGDCLAEAQDDLDEESGVWS